MLETFCLNPASCILNPASCILNLIQLFKYETGVGSSFDAGITNVQPIPEPATYLLMSVGFLVLFGIPYLRKWCRGYEFFG